MKILGFIGSSKKDGNTASLVKGILDKVREAGVETKAYYLDDFEIEPCKGCYGCKSEKMKCAIQDDMQSIYMDIDNADAIILGSPIYMWQMSAQAKLFTDRLFARFNPGMKKDNASKKFLPVFTHGNPDSEMFRTYFDYTKNMFAFLGFDTMEVYAVGNTQSLPVKNRKDIDGDLKKISGALIT